MNLGLETNDNHLELRHHLLVFPHQLKLISRPTLVFLKCIHTHLLRTLPSSSSSYSPPGMETNVTKIGQALLYQATKEICLHIYLRGTKKLGSN